MSDGPAVASAFEKASANSSTVLARVALTWCDGYKSIAELMYPAAHRLNFLYTNPVSLFQTVPKSPYTPLIGSWQGFVTGKGTPWPCASCTQSSPGWPRLVSAAAALPTVGSFCFVCSILRMLYDWFAQITVITLSCSRCCVHSAW
jgi:hypothetical protein